MQASLETSDYGEAVERAMEMRANPFLHAVDHFTIEIDRFLAEKLKNGHYTKQSVRAKRYTLKRFAAFVQKPNPADVTIEHVRRFYAHERERVVELTVQNYLMVIRSFYNWLRGRNAVRVNPVAGVELAKVETKARKKFCTAELRDKLIAEAPNEHLRFVLFCGFHAGMRKGEIIEARPDWFNIDGRVVNIDYTPTFGPKGKEARHVPLSRQFLAFLAEYGLRSPFMLRPEKKHGKATYRYNFTYAFEKYMKQQGCEWVTIHVMRHTFASQLAIKNVSIFKIAEWLGDDVRTTQKHYAHLLPKDDDIDKAFS